LREEKKLFAKIIRMASAQSFYNQSSVLKINVMVVDDDHVFLDIMSRMLQHSKYRGN